MSSVPAFAELGVASNFSFLRGASHGAELAARAAELGLAAIGIADRNSLAGAVRAHVAVKEVEAAGAALRLVVGARLVTTDGIELLAWPEDRAAHGRLCALLTAGNLRAPKGECHLALADILAHAEGMWAALLPADAAPTPTLPRERGREASAVALAGGGSYPLASMSASRALWRVSRRNTSSRSASSVVMSTTAMPAARTASRIAPTLAALGR